MPFIGNQLSTSFQNVETQTITGDGSTSYTLNNAVADGKDLLVYINNVKQEEGSGKSYTATGTTITFTEAVASTDSCYVVFIGQAIGTVTPKDGSIVSSMLADANLEMPNTLDLNGKELILDADADTSITADTDDRVDIKIAGTDTVHVNSSGIGIKTTSGSSFTQNASSDLVIGAGSGNSGMTLFSGTSSQGAISFADGTASDNTQYRGYINYAHNLDALLFGVSGAEKVRIDSSGNVGIGTNSPSRTLHVTRSDGTGTVVKVGNTGSTASSIEFANTGSTDTISIGAENNDLVLKSDDGDISLNTTGDPATASLFVERGGNVGIGTTSPNSNYMLTIEQSSSTSGDGGIRVQGESARIAVWENGSSTIGEGPNFYMQNISGGTYAATMQMGASAEIIFFQYPNAGAWNERMRIDSSGNFLVGNTSFNSNSNGFLVQNNGHTYITATSGPPLILNRLTNDGQLITLQQAGTTEGHISVSGTTVTYNGFAGSHESSGIPTNTPIGTVVSTIDELDVYFAKQEGVSGEENNPKAGQIRADHAKVKVSDTVGDKAVYGVVSNFNAQGKVNVASVGIGSVRVTGACAKGDLLESSGDGTAKVQSDDIVRSKTIGKVTIGNSSKDVKLVSCVLYCG